MEPEFTTGDLVVIRKSDTPQLGDIFAYESPSIGPVIHRIVDQEGERFIFKGDNNDWTDSYQPTQEDLIGEALFNIPRVGSYVAWLRQPIIIAILTAILGGFLMFGLFDNTSAITQQTTPVPRNQTMPVPGNQTIPDVFLGIQNFRYVSLIFSTLALFSGFVLGVFAFTKPETKWVSDNYEFIHSTAYRYTAAANPAVYNVTTIQPGEPIFDKLTCDMAIVVAYAMTSSKPVNISGNYRIFARISEENGWNRIMELQPKTQFSGGSFNSKVNLNVCDIRQLLNLVTELTGLQRSFFIVSIITEISTIGEVGDRTYNGTIFPNLEFGMDATQLYLLKNDDGRDPLKWELNGAVAGTRQVQNTISLLGIALPVYLARLAAIGTVLIGITGLIVIGFPMLMTSQQDELSNIHLKYASKIVKIDGHSSRQLGASQPVVDVGSIDDLALIAEHADALIMEHIYTNEHHFLVFTNGRTFRYAVFTS